jgi:copper(I)-binding protein
MNAYPFMMGLALLGGASAAVAAPEPCLPTVEQAWIRAAPPASTALAGYAVLRNDCPKPFSVTDVSSPDFAMGMIHETIVVGGVSQMRHARSLVVPARGSLAFVPGGKHMMLMHPRRKLKAGDRVQVSVKLAGGDKVTTTFVVRRDAPTPP